MNEHLIDPIGIILVTSGSKGDRLLFRYPFETDESRTVKSSYKRNPYASQVAEAFQAYSSLPRGNSSIKNDMLVGYSDTTLSNILAVKSDLCGKAFELKVDDVQFVGFPVLLHSPGQQAKRDLPSMISFNLVFILRASVSQSVVKCYHELSKKVSVAIRHEERRCGYLNQQKDIMVSVQDEMASMPEDSMESPFPLIVKKSELARHMKIIFQDLQAVGVVIVRINKWVEINFCLPQKVHSAINNTKIEPDAVKRCISTIRPYHAVLFLEPESRIIEKLPPDSSAALQIMIRMASPLKNLQTLALDADLALSQVFQLVSHLVYWGKAIIVYPLCENNIYVLSPSADSGLSSSLVEKFTEEFPGVSLSAFMSDFSLPTAITEDRDILGLPQQQAQHIKMVIWLLKNRLIFQIHQYVYLFPVTGSPRRSSRSRGTSQTFSSDEGIDNLRASSPDVGSVSEGSPGGFQQPLSRISEGSDESGSLEARWDFPDSSLGYLKPAFRQAILSVPAASNSDDLKKFIRLCPYFNGQHHLEDIMYYENMRRSQLMTVLDKFRSVLITCSHQDPAATFHVPSTFRDDKHKPPLPATSYGRLF